MEFFRLEYLNMENYKLNHPYFVVSNTYTNRIIPMILNDSISKIMNLLSFKESYEQKDRNSECSQSANNYCWWTIDEISKRILIPNKKLYKKLNRLVESGIVEVCKIISKENGSKLYGKRFINNYRLKFVGIIIDYQGKNNRLSWKSKEIDGKKNKKEIYPNTILRFGERNDGQKAFLKEISKKGMHTFMKVLVELDRDVTTQQLRNKMGETYSDKGSEKSRSLPRLNSLLNLRDIPIIQKLIPVNGQAVILTDKKKQGLIERDYCETSKSISYKYKANFSAIIIPFRSSYQPIELNEQSKLSDQLIDNSTHSSEAINRHYSSINRTTIDEIRGKNDRKWSQKYMERKYYENINS